MSIDARKKLIRAAEMQEATKKGQIGFVLLKIIDELETNIEKMINGIDIPKPADLSEMKKSIEGLKEKLEEEIIVELEIV